MKLNTKIQKKNNKKINQVLTVGRVGSLVVYNNGCRGLSGRETASEETLKAVYRF